MKNRTARSEIVACVSAIDAVDGILAKIASRCRFLHGRATYLFEFQLIDTLRSFEIKADSAGVLADRQRSRLGKSNILGDQFQRKVGLRPRRLKLPLQINDVLDIRRKKSGRPANKFKN